MQNTTVIAKFRAALPSLVEWINATIAAHETQAKPFSSIWFRSIPKFVPKDLLDRARVVYLPTVPRPPLTSLGIPELAEFERFQLDGITFRDMVFMKLRKSNAEDLHLHELVHVAQWDLLGDERFLLAYGVGLLQKGYRSSPLEEMAYLYQGLLTNEKLTTAMMSDVRLRTERLWSEVAPLVSGS